MEIVKVQSMQPENEITNQKRSYVLGKTWLS